MLPLSEAGRTAGSDAGYNSFADDAITQAAAHWLLGCVFVRFLEDNGWLDERNRKVAWIAGPADRLAIAKDQRTLFPSPEPRTYRSRLPPARIRSKLQSYLASRVYSIQSIIRSTRSQPTPMGAAKILQFFQKVDPDSNELEYDFSDPFTRYPVSWRPLPKPLRVCPQAICTPPDSRLRHQLHPGPHADSGSRRFRAGTRQDD